MGSPSLHRLKRCPSDWSSLLRTDTMEEECEVKRCRTVISELSLVSCIAVEDNLALYLSRSLLCCHTILIFSFSSCQKVRGDYHSSCFIDKRSISSSRLQAIFTLRCTKPICFDLVPFCIFTHFRHFPDSPNLMNFSNATRAGANKCS